jgi:hypothetical protein
MTSPPPGVESQPSWKTIGAASAGTTTSKAKIGGATREAARRWSALASSSRPRMDAPATSSDQPNACSGSPRSIASLSSLVASADSANAAPAATTIAPGPAPAPARRRRATIGTSATAPNTTAMLPTATCESTALLRAGAASASTAIPATMAPAASHWRRAIGSPSARRENASSSTGPMPSDGCTTVSGASARAAT